MRDLVDVEGKFGLNVLVLAFAVADGASVFCLQFRELDGNGEVGGVSVAERIADVVRERADSEGQLVRVVRIAEEIDDKVSGANVVGQIRKRLIAEWVVSDVLNDATTVGIGTCAIEFGGGQVRIAAQEQGNDGILPREVDELFVGKQGVSRDGMRPKCETDNCRQRKDSASSASHIPPRESFARVRGDSTTKPGCTAARFCVIVSSQSPVQKSTAIRDLFEELAYKWVLAADQLVERTIED